MSGAIPFRYSATALQRYSATEIFDIGRDTGEAVSIDYEGPIPFTDTLEKVDINIQPPQLSPEAQEKTKNWSMMVIVGRTPERVVREDCVTLRDFMLIYSYSIAASAREINHMPRVC